MIGKHRLRSSFFKQNALDVAPQLLGKTLVRQFEDGTKIKAIITETEAYCGEEDVACHAHKGRTPRTEIMYHEGGKIYVYLIYGMYWLLNFVTGPRDHPQAVLIRAVDLAPGPGKTGKLLQLDKSFYGENLITSGRLWVENTQNTPVSFTCKPRVGIDYAGPEWSQKPWRFVKH